MKLTYIVGIAALTAIATTLVLSPILARSETPAVITKTVYVPQPTLNSSQIIWLSRLMQCESGMNAKAVNANDLDNTPSYGILQFKPSTFKAAAIRFGLASTSNYMDAASQVVIVMDWMLYGGIDWHWQFPDCTSKLGVPPTQ